MRVSARLGPDAATIDDIIAEAGVARGTFYNYFLTRDDVLVAVASTLSDSLLQEMNYQRDLPDPADRVSRAVRTFIRTAAADSVAGWVIVRIALIAAPLGTAMRDYLAEDVDAGLAAGRFQARSVQAACDTILGMGLMGMRSVLRGEATKDHAEHMAEMVLRALAVPDATEIASLPLGGRLDPDPGGARK